MKSDSFAVRDRWITRGTLEKTRHIDRPFIDIINMLLTWLLVLNVLPHVLGAIAPAQGKCNYITVYKMRGADCSNIHLVNIPPATRNIQVLDASVNRIRVLRNNSLTSYIYLKYLYLNDNSITVIEPAAFESLYVLEVLDLSLNAIHDFTPILPEYLGKLYLGDNPLRTFRLSRAVSLWYLNLANCLLTELSALRELPKLQQLNISGNALENIDVAQVASFCKLESVYISNKLINPKYLSSCDCVSLKRWTIRHSINIVPYFNCTIPDINMICISNSSHENRAFTACQVALQQEYIKYGMLCSVLFITVIIVVVAFLYRLRRNRIELKQKSQSLGYYTTPPRVMAIGKNEVLNDLTETKF